MVLAAWWLVAAQAQVPIPAPRDARSLDADTPCPDVPEGQVPGVVTTTVGPARHRGDGSYAWVCPVAWGGALEPTLAVDPAGTTWTIVADGAVFRTVDGGCGVSPIPLPGADLEAVTTFWWRDGFWVVATDPEARVTEVFQVQEGTLASFTTLEGLVAEDAEPGGPSALWVAGLQPRPTVFRVDLLGGLSGDDEPLTDLPSADRVSGLTIAAADEDEVWLTPQRGVDRSFWFGQYLPSTGLTLWEAPEGSWRSVLGPVKYDDLWLASLDGRLHTAGQITGAFLPVESAGGQVAWTGLQVVGERLFAGTPTELLAVTGFDADLVPVTSPVFALSQLARPVDACLVEGCTALLDEIGAAADVTPDDPAACPDGRTLAELEPEGCACAGTGRGGVGLAGLLGLLVWRRRRSDASRVW